ncbi:MAG: HNH endonuclease [Anaerolineae bacterium]|nr:HNH endonuclease [Anaerolineae bacterium]
MALDREFAESLVNALGGAGWHTVLPDDPLPNPLDITFSTQTHTRRLIIYARKITPQSSAESDHGRPTGEMHVQMLFDGDQRGRGVRNHLRFETDAHTVLFGFYRLNDDYVVAAYDPIRHREYAYSKSLQVKQWKIEEAVKFGIAFQTRQTDEVVVIFHLDQILQYLDLASEFHNLTPDTLSDTAPDETLPPAVRRAFVPILDTDELPVLDVEEREQRVAETTRYIRNHQFRRGILSVYQRCAICGFQYDYILDAAHIVPVAEGGTDTYDNGLGLCPNCHRMFDKGLILVDRDCRIYINPRYAEEYDQMGLAGSLDTLQQTLRETLWLPEDEHFHPSVDNLRQTFEARR